MRWQTTLTIRHHLYTYIIQNFINIAWTVSQWHTGSSIKYRSFGTAATTDTLFFFRTRFSQMRASGVTFWFAVVVYERFRAGSNHSYEYILIAKVSLPNTLTEFTFNVKYMKFTHTLVGLCEVTVVLTVVGEYLQVQHSLFASRTIT